MSALGDALREERDRRGQTVVDIADRLGVPAEWLKDLEEGHFEAFGNEVHAQAVIRLYAGELDLDADALLKLEDRLVARTGATFEPRVAREPTRRDLWRWTFSQAARSSDSTRFLAIVAGLEVLAGIGMLVIRGGG